MLSILQPLTNTIEKLLTETVVTGTETETALAPSVDEMIEEMNDHAKIEIAEEMIEIARTEVTATVNETARESAREIESMIAESLSQLRLITEMWNTLNAHQSRHTATGLTDHVGVVDMEDMVAEAVTDMAEVVMRLEVLIEVAMADRMGRMMLLFHHPSHGFTRTDRYFVINRQTFARTIRDLKDESPIRHTSTTNSSRSRKEQELCLWAPLLLRQNLSIVQFVADHGHKSRIATLATSSM